MNELELLIHVDCSIRVYRSNQLTGKDSQYTEIILPNILAICLILSGTYSTQQ